MNEHKIYRNTFQSLSRRTDRSPSYNPTLPMADIELTHLKSISQRKGMSQSFQGQVPCQSLSVRSPFNSKAFLGAGQTGTRSGSKNQPMPPQTDYDSVSPDHRDRENHQGILRFRRPLTSTKDLQDILDFEDPGQPILSYADDALEDDHPDQYSESNGLLKKKNQCVQNHRRIPTTYQRGASRSYYRSAKALFLERVRDIAASFSTSRKSRGMDQMFVRYDQIPQPLITSYISEEQFWMLLKRFFGLLPLPGSLIESFPNNVELAYIKNYLKSKPTPIQNGDEEDDGRDLVRVCTKLTTFIFSNRQSKKLFLGADRGIYRRSKTHTWEIFQSFGLIHQFCDEPGSRQHFAFHRDAWLQVSCLSRSNFRAS